MVIIPFKAWLLEKYHSVLQVGNKFSSGPAEIFKNPNRKEMKGLEDTSRYKELRGLIHGPNAYVWDADKALHYRVKEHLHLPPSEAIHLTFYQGQLSAAYRSGMGDDVSPEVKQHPWYKRNFKS